MANVNVSWDAVTLDDQGEPLQNAVVSYDVLVDGVFNKNVPAPTLTTQVTGVAPGPHAFTVVAKNVAGDSVASAPANLTVPSNIPAAPGNVGAVLA